MIEISEAMWPVVSITWSGELLDEDFDTYLGKCEQILIRRQPYVIVINLNLSPNLPSTQLKRFFKKQNEWIQANESVLKTVCLGMVFGVNERAGHAAINAHLRLRPTPFPVWVVENSQQAEEWAYHLFEAVNSNSARLLLAASV